MLYLAATAMALVVAPFHPAHGTQRLIEVRMGPTVTPMPPPGFVWADDLDEPTATAVVADTPAAEPSEPDASATMSVPQACAFMASATATPEEKKAFLASKGVPEFVIAQAECAAPEDNVQGHPELPEGAGVAADVMSVPQACAFMASATATPEEKKAFLASKGVPEFVIAQAECAAPEDNVQGHPELPGADGDLSEGLKAAVGLS